MTEVAATLEHKSSPADKWLPEFRTGDRRYLCDIVVCALEALLDATRDNKETVLPEDKSLILPVHAVEVSSIPIRTYCRRFLVYLPVKVYHGELFVVAMIYIERLFGSGRVPVNRLTIHRLLLASLMCATAMYVDFAVLHRDWGLLGGVDTKEACQLQAWLFQQLDYSLYVPAAEFADCYMRLSCRGRHRTCIDFCRQTLACYPELEKDPDHEPFVAHDALDELLVAYCLFRVCPMW